MSRNRSRGPRTLATAVAATVVTTLAGVGPALAVEAPPTKLPGTDLALTKSADRASYAPGDSILYSITVRNAGSDGVSIARIRVVDPTLPDLVRVAGPESADGRLDPGESLTYTGARTVTQGECGPLSNTATVSLITGPKGHDKDTGAPDENAANDSDTITVSIDGGACGPPPAPLVTPPPVVVQGTSNPPPVIAAPKCIRTSLTTRIPGATGVPAGGTLGLRVVIANRGLADSGPATVSLTLPPSLSVRTLAPGRSLKGGKLVVRVGNIPVGGTRTVRVGLRADSSAAGAKTVRATVTTSCAKASIASARVRVAAALPRVQPAVTG